MKTVFYHLKEKCLSYISGLDDEYMAYVSYLHMEKKYRQSIQPSPPNTVNENQDRSIPLQNRILQTVQEDSQNPIDANSDSVSQLGEADENYPSTFKTGSAISDDTTSRKSDKYLRHETIIPTEVENVPASETVNDSIPNNKQASTVTVRALIHGPQQHRQNQASSTVFDVHNPDEQEQLIRPTLTDTEEEHTPPPPPLPKKTYKTMVPQTSIRPFQSDDV